MVVQTDPQLKVLLRAGAKEGYCLLVEILWQKNYAETLDLTSPDLTQHSRGDLPHPLGSSPLCLCREVLVLRCMPLTRTLILGTNI
jgi:hypothetical protein